MTIGPPFRRLQQLQSMWARRPRPGLVSFQLSHPQGGTPYLVAELFWHSEDAFKAWAATAESAEVRNHAQGCGTTFTTYTGDVAEV